MSTLRAFTMPKWGIEMTEGILAEWSVAEGEAFDKGQLLASVETDKIVNEIEADFASVCLRRVAEEGDTLGVGELLAVFGEPGASADEIDGFVRDFKPADTAFSGEDADDAPTATPQAVEGNPQAAVAPPPGVAASKSALAGAAQGGVDLGALAGSGKNGRVLRQDVDRALRSEPLTPGAPVDNRVQWVERAGSATDVARRVAHARGVSLDGVAGSGKGGRVRVRDLPSATAGPVRFSAQRVQIARRLTESYREIPHYHLQRDVSFDAVMAARKAYNVGRELPASLNDFLVRAVAKALEAHPVVNAHVFEGATETFDTANVAIAVATENGLITPVVHDAARRPFPDLCAASRDLVSRAREGALTRDDLKGGTFTVSNLGMFGVHRFTALINPPQAAILAVGAARRQPVERDGGIAFENVVSLTLGCDHRVIDGAVGGRFLADLCANLAAPADLFE